MKEQGKDYDQRMKIWKYVGVFGIAVVLTLTVIYIVKQCKQPEILYDVRDGAGWTPDTITSDSVAIRETLETFDVMDYGVLDKYHLCDDTEAIKEIIEAVEEDDWQLLPPTVRPEDFIDNE